jgi:hypothetical protein
MGIHNNTLIYNKKTVPTLKKYMGKNIFTTNHRCIYNNINNKNNNSFGHLQ